MASKKLSQKVKNLRGKGSNRRSPKNSAVTSAQKIEQAELMFQAVRLRRDGYTIHEIAKALEVSPATIHTYLLKVLDETIKEYQLDSEQERQLQIDKLDQLIRIYTPYAVDRHMEERVDERTGTKFLIEVPPNPIYANLLLSVEARRAKLLALDKPEVKKMEVSGIREYLGVEMDKV